MRTTYRTAAAAFGSSLALAAGITAATIRAADADPAPNVLTAIHTLTDAAVMVDATTNYGLPVTAVDCYGTGPQDPAGITDPGIACWLTGPNGWTAWAVGVILPTLPDQLVTVGVVYWPVVNGKVDGRI